MSKSLKSWLLLTSYYFQFIKLRGALLCFLCFYLGAAKAQVVNYVNNGSFEECGNCVNYIGGSLSAKYWTAFDSTQFSYGMLSKLPPSQQVPMSGFTWQMPRTGNNFIIGTVYLPNDLTTPLTYARNFLKQNLQGGKMYCVKFYCNVSNQSTYGIDGIGAYFGDGSLDTITKYIQPITYLIPQVKNPDGNVITDTLNWTLITGTFTATGMEKYMVIGNFKSSANTNSVLVNPANLPTIGMDILYDDVSCIELDLPADAGFDYYLVPGDSAFIGRTPDVGINEACTWYQLPNLATPIATVAGMYVKPSITTTYVVRQEICGLVKWDTVIVFKSAVGIESLKLISDHLKLFPVPASELLHLQWSSEVFEKTYTTVEILNNLGQVCLEQELMYENKQASVSVKELPVGVYSLRLKSVNSSEINKRFAISR